MTLTIILDLSEDRLAFSEIKKHCFNHKYSMIIEQLYINMIESGLSIIKIGSLDMDIDTNEFPYYPQYLPLRLKSAINVQQSALLAFLKLFYNIPVTYDIEGDIATYYFIDKKTLFLLREDIYSDNMTKFYKLMNNILVSDNPMMESILKVYPNPNIERFEKYHIWYINYRSSIEDTQQKLNVLLNQEYFCIANIAQQRDISIDVAKQIVTAYGYKQLGKDCTCIGEHFISDECTYKYSEILDYSDKNFYTIPIHGPLINGEYLGEDFFITCLEAIDNNVVPIVPIRLSYIPDRRTLVAAVAAYAQILCNVSSICGFVDPDNTTVKPCSRLTPCTYVSCSTLSEISVDILDDVGILVAKCGDIETINRLLSLVDRMVDSISVIDVESVNEGIKVRFNEWNINGKNSLLLKDGGGFFVGVWDFSTKENLFTEKNKKSKIDYTAEELENIASSMPNYEMGQNYAYTGFYQLTNKDKILLPGLLKTIPFLEPLSLSSESLLFKNVGLKCKVYSRKNGQLLFSVPTNGKSNGGIMSQLHQIVQKCERGEYHTEWGKNYLSLTGEFNPNSFEES